MVLIKLAKMKLQELDQELNQLEKKGFSPENLDRVYEIQKQIKELKVVIRLRKQQLGLHVA